MLQGSPIRGTNQYARVKLGTEEAKEWLRILIKEQPGGDAERTTASFQINPKSRAEMQDRICSEKDKYKFKAMLPPGDKDVSVHMKNSSFVYGSLLQEAIALQEAQEEVKQAGVAMPEAWMFPSTKNGEGTEDYKSMVKELYTFLSTKFADEDFDITLLDVGGDILKSDRKERDVCVRKAFQELYTKKQLGHFKSLRIEVYGPGCDMHANSLGDAQKEVTSFMSGNRRPASMCMSPALAYAFGRGVSEFRFMEDTREKGRANDCFAGAVKMYEEIQEMKQPTALLKYVNEKLFYRPDITGPKKETVLQEVAADATGRDIVTQLSACYVFRYN